jgi:hypothetical protein
MVDRNARQIPNLGLQNKCEGRAECYEMLRSSFAAGMDIVARERSDR